MSSTSKTIQNDDGSKDRLLDAAIVEYLRIRESQASFDSVQFLEKYSPVADDLREFLQNETQFTRMMKPIRQLDQLANPRKVDFPFSFGEYDLIREIGRGGMGVIYEARQKSLKRRKVALKMIRESRFATADDLARFRNEAEASAELDHPNIVPIYRVGQFEDQPFFTMKLVEGGSLKDALADGAIDARKSAKIAKEIAMAVNYAHQRGILHRDLKPANILLRHPVSESSSMRREDEPTERSSSDSPSDTDSRTSSIRPMVSDFGLAKQLGEDIGLTATGAVLGTPSFMSPEQATGARNLTISTDIYGIGAILYNMLTGNPPFEGFSPVEIASQVRDKKPSSIRDRNSRVDADLETICMKCLEKDPNHRYPTAADLANDLQRYLDGIPIQARRSTSLEQIVKWSKRNRTKAALLSAIAGLLILSFIGTLVFTFRLNSETERRGEALASLEAQELETKRQRDQALRRLFDARFAEVSARRSSGASGQRLKALAAAREAVAQLPFVDATERELFELRSETIGCLGLADVAELGSWQAPIHRDFVLAFSHDLSLFAHQLGDGQPIVVYETDDLIKAGTIEGAAVVAEIDVGNDSINNYFQCNFSPCGRFFYAASNQNFQAFRVTVYDFETRKVIARESAFEGAFGNVDGTPHLAVASEGEIKIFSLPSMQLRNSYEDKWQAQINGIEFSPDGKLLARFGSKGLAVIDRETGDLVWQKPGRAPCDDVCWHPVLNELAVPNASKMEVWKVGENVPKKTFANQDNVLFQVEYSPDGRTIATTTWSNVTRLWDAESGDLIFSIAGMLDRFSKDGKRLGLCALRTGIFRFENERLRRTLSPADAPHLGTRPMDLSVHPDGQLVAMGEPKDCRICDIASGRRLIDVPAGGTVRFHPDGKSMFTGIYRVRRWPLNFELQNDGSTELTIGPPSSVFRESLGGEGSYDIDPTGKYIAAIIGSDIRIALADEPNKPLLSIKAPRGAAKIDICEDRRLIAVGNHHAKNASVYDGVTGKLLHVVETPTHARPRLSPDGAFLVVSFSGTAELYDTSDWSLITTFRDSGFDISWPTSFSPDSRYLLVSSRNAIGTLIVEAKTGKHLIRVPSRGIQRDASAIITSDGHLIAFGEGNAVEAWDLPAARAKLKEMGLDWTEAEQSRANPAGTNPAGTVRQPLKFSKVTIAGKESRDQLLRNSSLTSIEGWIDQSPEDANLRFVYSLKLFDKGQLQQAVDEASTAIRLNWKEPNAKFHFGRAKYFDAQNRPVESIDDLRRCVECLEREGAKFKLDVRLSLARKILEASDFKTSDYEFASNLCSKVLEDSPQNELGQMLTGKANYRMGNYEKTVEVLNSLVKSCQATQSQTPIGTHFLLALANSKTGSSEIAGSHYLAEIKARQANPIRAVSVAREWQELREEVETELDPNGLKEQSNSLNAIELAAASRFECGFAERRQLIYINAPKRLKGGHGLELKPGNKLSAGVAKLVQQAESIIPKSNQSASALFWDSTAVGDRLKFEIQADEAGVYDGLVGLAHGPNFGELVFLLNGTIVSQPHDCYSDQLSFGEGPKLELQLLKGVNELEVIVTGKSKVSAGFSAAFEFLKLRKRAGDE